MDASWTPASPRSAQSGSNTGEPQGALNSARSSAKSPARSTENSFYYEKFIKERQERLEAEKRAHRLQLQVNALRAQSVLPAIPTLGSDVNLSPALREVDLDGLLILAQTQSDDVVKKSIVRLEQHKFAHQVVLSTSLKTPTDPQRPEQCDAFRVAKINLQIELEYALKAAPMGVDQLEKSLSDKSLSRDLAFATMEVLGSLGEHMRHPKLMRAIFARATDLESDLELAKAAANAFAFMCPDHMVARTLLRFYFNWKLGSELRKKAKRMLHEIMEHILEGNAEVVDIRMRQFCSRIPLPKKFYDEVDAFLVRRFVEYDYVRIRDDFKEVQYEFVRSPPWLDSAAEWPESFSAISTAINNSAPTDSAIISVLERHVNENNAEVIPLILALLGSAGDESNKDAIREKAVELLARISPNSPLLQAITLTLVPNASSLVPSDINDAIVRRLTQTLFDAPDHGALPAWVDHATAVDLAFEMNPGDRKAALDKLTIGVHSTRLNAILGEMRNDAAFSRGLKTWHCLMRTIAQPQDAMSLRESGFSDLPVAAMRQALATRSSSRSLIIAHEHRSPSSRSISPLRSRLQLREEAENEGTLTSLRRRTSSKSLLHNKPSRSFPMSSKSEANSLSVSLAPEPLRIADSGSIISTLGGTNNSVNLRLTQKGFTHKNRKELFVLSEKTSALIAKITKHSRNGKRNEVRSALKKLIFFSDRFVELLHPIYDLFTPEDVERLEKAHESLQTSLYELDSDKVAILVVAERSRRVHDVFSAIVKKLRTIGTNTAEEEPTRVKRTKSLPEVENRIRQASITENKFFSDGATQEEAEEKSNAADEDQEDPEKSAETSDEPEVSVPAKNVWLGPTMRRPLGGSGSVKLSQRRAVPPLPLNEFMASTRSLPAPTSLSSNTSSSSIPPLPSKLESIPSTGSVMPTDRRGLQTRIRQALARTVLCLRVAKAVDALALLSASQRPLNQGSLAVSNIRSCAVRLRELVLLEETFLTPQLVPSTTKSDELQGNDGVLTERSEIVRVLKASGRVTSGVELLIKCLVEEGSVETLARVVSETKLALSEIVAYEARAIYLGHWIIDEDSSESTVEEVSSEGLTDIIPTLKGTDAELAIRISEFLELGGESEEGVVERIRQSVTVRRMSRAIRENSFPIANVAEMIRPKRAGSKSARADLGKNTKTSQRSDDRRSFAAVNRRLSTMPSMPWYSSSLPVIETIEHAADMIARVRKCILTGTTISGVNIRYEVPQLEIQLLEGNGEKLSIPLDHVELKVSGPAPVKTNIYLADGVYHTTLRPEKTGKYFIDVLLDSRSILPEPAEVEFTDIPIVQQMGISGSPDTYVGGKASFEVMVYEKGNVPLHTAVAKLEGVITGPCADDPVIVTPLSRGLFQVEYTASRAGVNIISLYLSGVLITRDIRSVVKASKEKDKAKSARSPDKNRTSLTQRADHAHTDLMKAIRSKDDDLLFATLEIPSLNAAANDNEALRVASEIGYLKAVEELLCDPKVDPAAVGNYAITLSAWHGHADVVKRLLRDKRVDPACKLNYAIRGAVDAGHAAVVAVLVSDPRVDPTVLHDYCVRTAAEKGFTEIVKILVADARVDPTAEDNYALREAVKNGHLEVADVLRAAIAEREKDERSNE